MDASRRFGGGIRDASAPASFACARIARLKKVAAGAARSSAIAGQTMAGQAYDRRQWRKTLSSGVGLAWFWATSKTRACKNGAAWRQDNMATQSGKSKIGRWRGGGGV